MVAGTQAGIIQVLQTAPQVSIPPNIPELFESFQQEQHSGTFEDFQDFLARKVVEEDCAYIEKYTRKQSKSVFWKKQRIGAITASIFHRVANYVHSKEDNYIVKEIMGLCEFGGNNATNYGLRTERLAKSLYAQHLKEHHRNSHVTDCGLLVSKSNPLFRATPDGKVNCSCCGTGLLEIKCPYSSAKKGLNAFDLASLGNYHVAFDSNGNIKLKTTSPWYTQIQGHMGVSGYPWCDFVMYTKKPPHITVERIYFREEEYELNVAKAVVFYEKFVMPKFRKN